MANGGPRPAWPLLAMLLFSLTASLGLADEDCLWYLDKNGSWHPGFDCNFFTFCCGNCYQRYCCIDPLKLITERQQKHCLAFSPKTIAGIASAVVLFVAIVATIICCFMCSCCYLYQRRQHMRTPFQGARIHDVTERLPRLIKPSDRYPFLLLHVGTNDTAKNDLERITADYVALGRRIKEFEAQVVFSSILPVQGKGRGRDRRIVEVNEWLRRWCRREGFGFFDHGMVFQEEGVLGRDGLHLTKRGKSIFASRLANLVRRALN
ncbi:protein shisa-4 isoform X1 [Chrysemys picta bellii]|uniref:protein shisa-4 isoform X1 n=2 Tax=Emydidae TaxID=8476 RepID=UPI0032B2DBEA